MRKFKTIVRKEEATPLPNGFKEGDAAVFRNAMNICPKAETQNIGKEKEIILVEKQENANKVMNFHVRYKTWS